MQRALTFLVVSMITACGKHPPSAMDDAGTTGDVDLGATNDASACFRCSGDLHNVIDCASGAVITACGSNQGCGPNGTCVAPCDAAKANMSNVGCDYYSIAPGTDGEMERACFAAFIANTWSSDVTLDLSYQGQKLNAADFAYIPSGSGSTITYTPIPNGKLPAGRLAILFLARMKPVGIDCPNGVNVAVTTNVSSQVTQVLHAFHIAASAPVVAYDEFPYGGALSFATSATLLLPTNVWDTNYIAVDGFARAGFANNLNEHVPFMQPFIQIVATQPSTMVTIKPTAAIAGGNGVAPVPINQPHTYALNAGEVIQIKQDEELNGSIIQSNVPVGVWGGHGCMFINATDSPCDTAHQQLPPIRAMGSEYVAVKHRERSQNFVEQPPWRIVGAVDGTQLDFDPPVSGAPGVVNKGQLSMFYAAGPFVVKSQDADHPFYLGGHMMSMVSQGTSFLAGDPEWVNVIPPEQYLRKYLFFVDPTMAYSSVVFVRRQAADKTYKDVTLDCAGVISGWKQVGTSPYQTTFVDLTVQSGTFPNGGPKKVGNCDNGLREAHSDEPFALTVWGWDVAVSYAYPGGAGAAPINGVVVPPTPN